MTINLEFHTQPNNQGLGWKKPFPQMHKLRASTLSHLSAAAPRPLPHRNTLLWSCKFPPGVWELTVPMGGGGGGWAGSGLVLHGIWSPKVSSLKRPKASSSAWDQPGSAEASWEAPWPRPGPTWALLFFHPFLVPSHHLTLSTCQTVSWGPGRSRTSRQVECSRYKVKTSFTGSCRLSCQDGSDMMIFSDSLTLDIGHTGATPTDPWLKLHVRTHVSALVWLCFMVLCLTLSTQR